MRKGRRSAVGNRRTEKSSVTLRDVADASGVTPMTVSNVINKRHGTVSALTATRVLEVVEQLGYRPNAAGRRLRTNLTKTIGMVVQDQSHSFLEDPFTASIIAGLGNFATDHGWSLLLQGVHSPSQLDAPLLSHQQTDGICVLSSGSRTQRRTLFQRVHRIHQPVIVFQDRFLAQDVCSIRQNDRDGARQLTSHLLESGAQKFFLLLPQTEWPAMLERERGVREALRKSQTNLHVVQCGNEGMADTSVALSSAIKNFGLPHAIIGGNDRMAIAALNVLAQMNVPVPGKVRVTGYNAFEFAQYATPSLTTVRSPAYRMGARGGELMLRRLAEGNFGDNDVVFPIELVLGDSA